MPKKQKKVQKDVSAVEAETGVQGGWLAAAVPVALLAVAAAYFMIGGGGAADPRRRVPGGAVPTGGKGRRTAAKALDSWNEGFFADMLSNGDSAATRAVLYPNGGDGAPEAVSIDSDEAFSALGRVYNDRGQIVPSRRHFADGESLYRGPTNPGTHFQWPAVRVGLKRTVPGLFGGDGTPVEIETLTDPSGDPNHRDPRVFYVHNFLSADEADELIRFATADENPWKIAHSTAGSHKSWDQDGGRKATLSTRTSMNAFDTMTQNAARIKRRAFRLLRMGAYDESLADGIQILRYEVGQAYTAHHDFFPVGQSSDFNWDPSKGGSNRFATIFLYLSDVEFGGQTVFPHSYRLTNDTSAELVRRLGDSPPPDTLDRLSEEAGLQKNSWEDRLVHTCYERFAVPPRRGDAILFYSQRPDGRLDHSSFHGACPVLKGTKWGANLWVWNACRHSLCRHDSLQPAKELVAELKAPFQA